MAIGASRTYLGVHWFSDVVGGLIVGAFFLLGAEWVLTPAAPPRSVHVPVRGRGCSD